MTRTEVYQQMVDHIANHAVEGEEEEKQVDIRPLPDKANRLPSGKVKMTYTFQVRYHKPEKRMTEIFTGSEELPSS